MRAFVRYNSRGDRGTLDWLDPAVVAEVEPIAGELRDIESVSRAVGGVAVVFHLGAQIAIPYSYVNPRDYFEVNAIGTLNVAQASLAAGVERVIHTSTSEVYGSARTVPITEDHPLEPQSPYAASKVAADKLIDSYHRSFDLPATVLRPFNTYGPHQSARAILPTIVSQALAGSTLRLGSLHPRRDLTYVEDTAAGFIAVAEAGDEVVGRTLQLGTGTDVSIGDLVQVVGELLGKELDGRARPGARAPGEERGRAADLEPRARGRADGVGAERDRARRRLAHDRLDRAPRRALPRRRVRDLSDAELERIRAAYAERDAAGAASSAWLDRPYRLRMQELEWALLEGLARRRRRSARHARARGRLRRRLLPQPLPGLRRGARRGDRPDGAPRSRRRASATRGSSSSPATRRGCRGTTASFDVVTQFTCLSSVLDAGPAPRDRRGDVARAAARRGDRVLRHERTRRRGSCAAARGGAAPAAARRRPGRRPRRSPRASWSACSLPRRSPSRRVTLSTDIAGITERSRRAHAALGAAAVPAHAPPRRSLASR